MQITCLINPGDTHLREVCHPLSLLVGAVGKQDNGIGLVTARTLHSYGTVAELGILRGVMLIDAAFHQRQYPHLLEKQEHTRRGRVNADKRKSLCSEQFQGHC